MGTPGLSHSLLALWGPLSVELGTKRPRAGLFCHVQTGGYGEAGYKGREVLVIMVQKHPLATPVISLDGDLPYPDFQPLQFQVLWTRIDASDRASLDLEGSRRARGFGRAASGPAESSSFADTGLPGCWPLASELLWETEGARCGQAKQRKPALGTGDSKERAGNSRRNTELWRLGWGFQEGFREKGRHLGPRAEKRYLETPKKAEPASRS